MFNKIFTIMKCYLLVHKAQNYVVAVYYNKETAILSKRKLNRVFNLPMYDVIEKQLFFK